MKDRTSFIPWKAQLLTKKVSRIDLNVYFQFAMMTTEAIREKLLQFLEDNGLERHLFQVEMDDDRVRLYPLGRLGDDWKKVNSLLPGFWCKNPKEPWLSHWLINLRVVRAVLKKHDEEKQKRVDDFK